MDRAAARGAARPRGRADGRARELFAAWRRFFERISEQGTTVLVFEDLHWADQGLLDFVESLLEWSRSYPDPDRGAWPARAARATAGVGAPAVGHSSRSTSSRWMAQEMTRPRARHRPGAAAAAVQAIVGARRGRPALRRRDRAHARRRGPGSSATAARRLADPDAPFAVPPSLQALIAARLDGLDAADRLLLQDASVLGRTFPSRGARGGPRHRGGRGRGEAHRAGTQGVGRARQRPAFPGARPVRLRPRARPRRRLQPAVAARPDGPAPLGRPLLRAAPGRRAVGSGGEPLPRRLASRRR